jgi:hypothetical protein
MQARCGCAHRCCCCWPVRWPPRSRLCLIPFSGVGKILGGQPNSKNPNLCRSCFEAAPTGSYDQRVGIGLHLGTAAVGNIEKGDVRDFTAAGDVVNTAARLQSSALAGQIVMSQAVFASSGGPEFETEQAELMLKGKQEPMPVRILRVD